MTDIFDQMNDGIIDPTMEFELPPGMVGSPVITEGTEVFNMRKAVLAQAMEAVLTDRQTTYGTPEANFGLIADLWTAYKRVDFRPDEVAAMMILLKLARSTNANKLDNPVDIAGYAACMAEVDPRDMM